MARPKKDYRDGLPVLVKDFATYKLTIQGCSEKTVREYLLDLRTFLRYMTAVREGLPTEGEEFAEISIAHLDKVFLLPSPPARFTIFSDMPKETGKTKTKPWPGSSPPSSRFINT